MIEIFSELYKIIGIGNLLTIVIFLLSTLIAYYLYFKTFYRLVFSQTTICRKYATTEDWKNDETEFESRIIFYNNGRKTLAKENIKSLQITAKTEIICCEQIVTNQKIQLKLYKKIVKLNFENLDTKNFIVLRIKHKGRIDISGRISESGKVLNTETKTWLKINFGILIALPIIALTPFFFAFENLIYFIPNMLISIILISIINSSVRCIHKMFFIPDKLTEVFLESKNHFNSEFKNEFE